MLRLVLLACLLPLASTARAQTDDFTAGFAAGLLGTEYGVDPASVTVAGGTVTVSASKLSLSDRRGAARSLLRRDGIRAVVFAGDDHLYTNGPRRPVRELHAFPRRLLFEPLLADPRWPRFSTTLQRHFRTQTPLVGSGNFGESFGLVGGDDWQFGLQACVFTQFDMKARHNDQLTDDFLVGLPYTWRSGRASWMARLYHISTHTGDEFLLHNPGFDRQKVSIEAVDLRASYDVGRGGRVYGGPGYVYRRFPVSLKPLYFQAGAEYTHGDAWRGLLRPVAALDLQKRQDYGWGTTNISARAGFQVEHRSQPSRRALVLVEYYRGRDVNGQFFVNDDESLGLGLHLYF